MTNSEKEFNNTVYLMEVISTAYRKKHKMSIPKFLELNEKVDLLGYIYQRAQSYLMDYQRKRCLN